MSSFAYNPFTDNLDYRRGGGGGGGGTIPLTPLKHVSDYDDFLAYVYGNGNPKLGWQSNSSYLQTNGTVDNPGQIYTFNADTVSIGLTLQNTNGDSANSACWRLGGGALASNWVVKVAGASTGVNRYIWYVGVSDFDPNAGPPAEPQNGCYFKYSDNINSGNWEIVCANGGVRTTVSLGTPFSTSFINLGVSINSAGTSAAFTINGTVVGTITTNIPTSVSVAPFVLQQYVSGTMPLHYIDLFYYTLVLTNARPGTQTSVGAGGGDVNGPSSSQIGNIAIFSSVDGKHIADSGMSFESQIPIGALAYYPNENGDSYLVGTWLKCDGTVYSQATYTTLFSRIGLINPGGVNWTARTSGATSTILAGVYGGGVHIIAGQNGVMRTSTDAITWTTATAGVSTNINALTFGGGNYVYAGDNGILATSTNGTTWQTKSPSIGPQAVDNSTGPFLAYNSGTFVGAVTLNGGILTSTDAVTWVTRNNAQSSTSSCGGVVYGGGKFVTVGAGGYASTSTDGITWTAQTTGTSTSLSSLSYSNSIFIAGKAGDGNVMSSTDGVTWTNRNTGSGIGNPTWASTFGAGQYIVWQSTGAARSTPDLVTWTARTTNVSAKAALHNGTIFVAGGNGGTIRTSTDVITWDARTSNTTSTITCLIYTGALHVYGTIGGGLGTSTDGITWVARTSGTSSNINALAYDGSLYHAAGCNFSLTSTDAITWTTNAGYSGTTSSILSMTFGNSLYVYAGAGGVLATSNNSTTWTSRTSGTASNILSLTYGSVYVYGGVGGVLASSTDAITWNSRTSGTVSNINALTFGTLYVYGGAGGVLASSTDATTWTNRTSPTTSSINALSYSSGNYVYAGHGGVVGNSEDAITFYSRVSTTTSNLFELYAGSALFFAGGVTSALQTSPIDYLYNKNTQFQVPTDNQLLITVESTTNFFRSLYIKAL